MQLIETGGPLRAWLATIGVGLAGGVALGATYRGWMRLVSTRPSFSWEGTLGIIGMVTVVVLFVSITATGRRRWHRRGARGATRALGGAAFLLLAAGPGAITLPIWVLGGLAVGRRGWPRRVRALLGVLALAGVAPLVIVSRRELAQLGLVRAVTAIALYIALMAVIARLFAVPTGSAAPQRRPAEAAAIAGVEAGAAEAGAEAEPGTVTDAEAEAGAAVTDAEAEAGAAVTDAKAGAAEAGAEVEAGTGSLDRVPSTT